MGKSIADPVQEAQKAINRGGMDLFQVVPAAVLEIYRTGLWRERRDPKGRPFHDFPAFVEHRQWHGLGIEYRFLVDHCCRDRPDTRAKLLEAYEPIAHPQPPPKHTGPGRGKRKAKEENAGDVITGVSSGTQRGTTGADYLTRRIARDAPEVLERMRAGEFPSVRQAAIAAGIIDPKRRLEQQAVRAVRRMDDREALNRIAEAIATRLLELDHG